MKGREVIQRKILQYQVFFSSCVVIHARDAYPTVYPVVSPMAEPNPATMLTRNGFSTDPITKAATMVGPGMKIESAPSSVMINMLP